MTGPGRPNKRTVARRRRQVVLFLVTSAAASESVVKQLATKLNVKERSILSDLDAVREEFELDTDAAAPKDLEAAIRAADTFRAQRLLGKRVTLGIAQGAIDPATGSALLEAIREQRQLLRAERQEEAQAVLSNLVPMTMDQVERFETWREAQAIRPLAPGESAPPPPEEALTASPPSPPESGGASC